jgi:enoyl-CoA hydratase/carnithine racemase
MAALDYETKGNVAVLALNNPPVNALAQAVCRGLKDGLERALADSAVRAILVIGRGRGFCAGADISEFGKPRPPDAVHLRHIVAMFDASPKPLVAAIHGNALGGGLELALCCDLRIASERARLGLPEVRLAVTPGAGGTQRLPRVVGVAKAKELILTGAVLTAAEAERIGLVNEVVPAGEAVARAMAIGEEIALRGPIAVREAKRLIDLATESDLDAGLAAELDASDRVFSTDDTLEGAAAFFAKREPDYHGR